MEDLITELRALLEEKGRRDAVGFNRFRSGFPSNVYATKDDRLFIASWNGVGSDNGDFFVVVRGRVLSPEGEIVPFEYRQEPSSDRTRTLTTFPMPEGFVLTVTALAQNFTAIGASTFVQVGLLRSTDADPLISALLISDFLHKREAIGWPGGRLKRSFDERGRVYTLTGTDPAAGVEITETVPTNAIWRLIALEATLVTSAVAGSRVVKVAFDAGAAANEFDRAITTVSQSASVTNIYAVSASGFSGGAAGTSGLHLPSANDLYLPPGSRIRTVTSNFDVGDNWSAPILLIEEWIYDNAF